MADSTMPYASPRSPDADEPFHGGYTRFELELEVTTIQSELSHSSIDLLLLL